MSVSSARKTVLALCVLTALAAQAPVAAAAERLQDWPRVTSAIAADPAIEARVRR